MENSQRTCLPDGGTEVQKRWDREERLLGKHTKTLFKSLKNKSVKFQEVPNADTDSGDSKMTLNLQRGFRDILESTAPQLTTYTVNTKLFIQSGSFSPRYTRQSVKLMQKKKSNVYLNF